MEHFVSLLINYTIHLLEAMGTLVIIVAATKAFYQFILSLFKERDTPIKVDLAKALTLALEFKLASEILKTVIVRTLDEMYILAAIIILRAILTFVIHWEIKTDGH